MVHSLQSLHSELASLAIWKQFLEQIIVVNKFKTPDERGNTKSL